jgi:phosphinothricin acetyltransferase
MPVVRPACRSDVAALTVIYNHYVEHSVATFDAEPVPAADRAAWLEGFAATGPFRLLVAAHADGVLGCASSSRYRAHPAFAQTAGVSIYLDPGSRGQGVGSLLYGALLDELRPEQVHLAVAGIALPNDAPVALHRKFGFADVGIFDEYAVKNGVYISSLWMQRRI